MKNSEDINLIALFRQDPEKTFRGILDAYQDRIFNLCAYMLNSREDAQDAAQDVFVKAYRSFKNFTPQASLYTWLYRIAVNTCIDYKRKSRGHLMDDEASITEIASPAPSPEKVYASKEIAGLIREALELLTPEFRAIIVLKEIEDLSYEEVAEVLRISLGTVKSRISRAREALRKSLCNRL